MEPQTGSGSAMKYVVWLIVLALVVWGVVSYSGKGETAPVKETGPIKIGVLLPMTGDAASYGEPARNVYQLAVEEINKAGGVDGRSLELIVEDSKCNGKDATNAAQKLINVDKVAIVLGGFCSGESIAATPVAEAAKVALFSAGSSSPDLTAISQYFFRNYPSDASQGKVLAEAAYTTKGWKKVALLQEQTDYSLGVYKAFSETFEGLGGTIVKEEAASSVTDFRTQLTKLKAAKADALFIDTQTPAVSERILKQLQDLNWKPALIFNDVTGGAPETLGAYKALVEGAISAEFTADPSNAKFAKLTADYKAKYGAELPFQSYGQTEYDAVYMIRDGILAVGNNGEKFAAWGRSVKDWDGASGKVTIGANGDRIGGHTLEVIKNGKAERYQQ